jgi:hypothetical protein
MFGLRFFEARRALGSTSWLLSFISRKSCPDHADEFRIGLPN